eukprot:12310416-Ditylum_brightwellii.AAC.1
MISDSAVKSIDWPAISKARDKQSFHQRKWVAKWVAEKIPVGVEMQDRGHWETAEYPRKCGEEMETALH